MPWSAGFRDCGIRDYQCVRRQPLRLVGMWRWIWRAGRQVRALVVPGRLRLFGLLGREETGSFLEAVRRFGARTPFWWRHLPLSRLGKELRLPGEGDVVYYYFRVYRNRRKSHVRYYGFVGREEAAPILLDGLPVGISGL